jgi:hypothetical protein
MKNGRSLNDLAAELTRQTQTKKDYIAPQGKIEAIAEVEETPQGKTPRVLLTGINGPLALTPYAHGQMADHLGIPKKYYDRMHAEQPELLAGNINTWLRADPENKRMIRTLDGQVRGFLSPKYRPLDNFDLANAVLPTLIEKKVQIVSSELTATRMYIKGILPELSDELPDGLAYGGHNRIGTDRGHLVAAIVISNSEIGDGTLRVEPSVFTTRCTNLMIMQSAAMKKYHVGRANTADDAFEVLRDETRQADDRAFWMKVGDVTMAAFEEKFFRAAIARIRKAGETPIEGEVVRVVDQVVEQLALPPATTPGILDYLVKGGDLTAWGMSSAITRIAGDVDDYELATTLERAGGAVLELPARTWAAAA